MLAEALLKFTLNWSLEMTGQQAHWYPNFGLPGPCAGWKKRYDFSTAILDWPNCHVMFCPFAGFLHSSGDQPRESVNMDGPWFQWMHRCEAFKLNDIKDCQRMQEGDSKGVEGFCWAWTLLWIVWYLWYCTNKEHVDSFFTLLSP